MLSILAPTLTGLQFTTQIPSATRHEIHGVARGMGVYYGGRCIVGEGMGIAAPLALLNNRAIFPLDVETIESSKRLVRRFHLNGLSDKYVGKARADFPYKWIRTKLAPLYLKSPCFRPLFSYLMAARTVVGLRSKYRKIDGVGYVDIAYEPRSDRIGVEVDASHLHADKYLIANELEGRLFKHLTVGDSSHVVKIPPWLEIHGAKACLTAPDLQLSWSLVPVEGCRLFIGREVVGERLNWAGCSYSPHADLSRFGYEVVFEKND